MIRPRVALVAATLVAGCALLVLDAASAAAAGGSGRAGAAAAAGSFAVVDEPDELEPGAPSSASGAHLPANRVEQIVLADLQLRGVMSARPAAQLVLRYDPGSRTWGAHLRERGVVPDFARIDVDDRTGEVLQREFLPIGEYPSRLTERAAIEAAVADRRVRRAANRWGGVGHLRARASHDGCCWEVDLVLVRDHGEQRAGETVVRADVVDATAEVTGVWTGIQIAWKMARGERMAFGGAINRPWAWLPFFALFALVAVDWRRVRTAFTADVAALLALGVSHECFLRGMIEWSVPLALPPLLWLGGRMLWLFVCGLPAQRPVRAPRTRVGRLAARRVPTWAIVVLVVALLGVRAEVALDGGNVIDVGYAGVAGARLELAGTAPWGNMPADNPRGDTYGPANYLAYVPATATLDDGDHDVWGTNLVAARVTSLAADALCVLLLAWIGWTWISRRGAALLAAGWVACPWTTWALASGVNDALVALPLLAAFALVPRATWRGVLVGLAAMVKFAPLVALAPLLRVGRERSGAQARRTLLGAAVMVLLGLAWVVWRLPQGVADDLHLFWDRTIAFQRERGSPFSPWGLYHLDGAQRVAQLLVIVGLGLMCVRPRARSAWQVAAGIAAALIASQLVVTHWFYLYIPWFVGFVLLVLVAARERPDPAASAADMLAP